VWLAVFACTALACENAKEEPQATALMEVADYASAADVQIEFAMRSARNGGYARDLEVTPVDPSKHGAVRRVLAAALRKYGPLGIRAFVSKIIVGEDITWNGVHLGGTNFGDRVFVATRVDAGDGWGLEQTLHCEVSSVLLNSYLECFSLADWNACNPPGFVYAGSGLDAIRTGRGGNQWSKQWLEKGFLYEYASASVLQDFNSIASALFSGYPLFFRLSERYGRVKKKVELTIRFFEKLSPVMSRAYFESLRPVTVIRPARPR
jgi:hypothetical protein